MLFICPTFFVDIIDSQQFNHVITNSIYRETVSDAIRGLTASSIPVFNMLDSTDCDRMFDNIIEKLSPKDVQFVI